MATQLGPDMAAVVFQANQEFSCDVYQALYPSVKEANLIFSPFGLHTALAMLWTGARGKTQAELWNGLKLTGKEDEVKAGFGSLLNSLRNGDHFTLSSANRLVGFWPHAKLRPDFVCDMAEYFDASASVERMDPRSAQERAAAARMINSWAELKTNCKITEVVTPEDFVEPCMILVNAVYFKAEWVEQFGMYSVHRRPFHLNGKATVEAEMMGKTAFFQHAELPELDASALELDYRGQNYEDPRHSMIIIRPNQVDGLRRIQEKLGSLIKNGEGVFRSRFDRAYVHVVIPKFKLETTLNGLVDILKKLGMDEMFDELLSDFSGIAEVPGNDPIYVSSMVQKAFIDVNEKGTEAGAVTRFGLRGGGEPPKTLEFVVDRPFYFQVVEKGRGYPDLVLFAGHCGDPTNL